MVEYTMRYDNGIPKNREYKRIKGKNKLLLYMEEIASQNLLRRLSKIKIVINGHTKIEIRNIAKQIRKEN